MTGKYKDAMKYYKQAMKIDESSVPALTGRRLLAFYKLLEIFLIAICAMKSDKTR